MQDSGGDSALSWAVDKNHRHVVDMLVSREDLEPSHKHVAAVTSHLTQSVHNTLADVGQAVLAALDTLRPKLGLWLLKQKLKDLEEAELIEKILVMAVRKCAEAIVDFLVQHSSVNLNVLDEDEPLLIRAANRKVHSSTAGYVDIVRSLISSTSCDVNVTGISGKTALFVACEYGNQAMVAVLLSHTDTRAGVASSDDHLFQ